MPAHKIPVGHLHEDLITLEREGETAKTVTREGDYYIVTTEYHHPVETRPALRELTHAARLGAIEQRAAWVSSRNAGLVSTGW